jgi:hypothetical protein
METSERCGLAEVVGDMTRTFAHARADSVNFNLV